MISKWNILLISSVLEEWIKCQKSWIYLQLVFDNGDIVKDIPYEYKKFKMTDRIQQDLMNGLKTNNNVKKWVKDNVNNIFQSIASITLKDGMFIKQSTQDSRKN